MVERCRSGPSGVEPLALNAYFQGAFVQPVVPNLPQRGQVLRSMVLTRLPESEFSMLQLLRQMAAEEQGCWTCLTRHRFTSNFGSLPKMAARGTLTGRNEQVSDTLMQPALEHVVGPAR